MAIPVIQNALSAGELAPGLWGRTDYAKYHIGASTMRNAFVALRGGAYSRAGTAFVAFSKQTGRGVPFRPINFQFSLEQGLMLEFGNFYMRVVSNGEMVVESTSFTITGISQSGHAQVTTSAPHGYTTGDWVFISGVVGMTEVNGRTFPIVVTGAATFQLNDVYGNFIVSSGYDAYVSGGTASRIYTLVTPWSENDLRWLKFTQSADVMSICDRNQITGTEYPSYNLSRIADDNWLLEMLDTSVPINPPSTISATPTVFGSGSSSTTYNSAYAYVVTAVSTTGDESVASPIANVTNSVDMSVTAGSIKLTWSAVAGAAYYNVYRAPTYYNNKGDPVPGGALFGFIATTYGNEWTDSNTIPDFSQVPPLHQNPFAPGQLQRVNVTSAGSGLSTVGYLITTSTGSGAHGYPIIVGAQMVAFIFDDPGQDYAPGDTITFSTAGYATGSILFGANPTAADTITLNGVTWTFVAAITGSNQTLIQGTLADTLVLLGSQLQAALNPSLVVASYTVDGTHLYVQYKTAGVAGNAYTLAASAATPSAGTLTGGAGPGGGVAPTGTLVVGPETGTYPSVVSYIQQRRVYANTANNPDTYIMSQPGSFQNFDRRIPTIDSDAITGTPWSLQVNGIQFMVPMPGGLVVLTGLQAWQLTGSGGSSLNPTPLTPSNQEAQPQAYNGCSAFVAPLRIDQDIIYIQSKGSIMRQLNYNYFLNIYTGIDITFLSSQLFTNYTINQTAWCQEPYKIIWVARSDGAFLSLTYEKSQELLGWARHDTQGYVWDMCSVTEPPVDALYMAVQRFPGGQNAYMIERMDNRIWFHREDSWCVDCGLSLSQPMPAAGLSVDTVTGAGIPVGVTNLQPGQDYVAATTVATIEDPTGTGCVVTPTVVGGQVTGYAFAGGSRYTKPNLIVIDNSGHGFEASASVVLDNGAVFTASQPVFAGGDVGKVIRGPNGRGKATITVYLGPTQVKANITDPFPVLPNSGGASAYMFDGTWTMTQPITVVGGLWHLIGSAVTGVADGEVVDPQVVDQNGDITLSTPASAVILGFGFGVQIQTLPLDTGNPTTQGQRKKIAAVTARVEASGTPFEVGTNQVDGSALSPQQTEVVWSNLTTVTLPINAPTPYGVTPPPLFTGDIRVPTKGGFEKPGQAAFQQLLPLPFQLSAIISEDLPGDMPEVNEGSKRGGSGQQQEQPG